MQHYRIAGLSLSIKNIDNPFFVKRMSEYRDENPPEIPDAEIVFSQKDYIQEPVGTAVGKRMGYRTYAVNEQGDYINYDRLEGTDNRTALMIADSSFQKVQASLRDVEPLGGASMEIRSFNMIGELFRMALIKHGGLVVHSSSISYEGQGILFSAPSGTGKSTHTGLWKQAFGDKVIVVNDDSPAITFADGKPYVNGTPWSGKTDINTNIRVPLKALVFLEQAPENEVVVIDAQEAVFRILREISVYPYRDMANRALELAEQILTSVPCYLLRCRPDTDAVKTIFEKIGE